MFKLFIDSVFIKQFAEEVGSAIKKPVVLNIM